MYTPSTHTDDSEGCGGFDGPDADSAPAAAERQHPAAGLPPRGRLPEEDGRVLGDRAAAKVPPGQGPLATERAHSNTQ